MVGNFGNFGVGYDGYVLSPVKGMRFSRWMIVTAIVTASVYGQTPVPVSSMQTVYNTGQAAFDKADWATAAESFTRLVAPPTDKPLSHSQAIIRARLASAELHLGKLSQALYSGKLAAAALDPAAGVDAADAWLTLADADAYSHAKRSISGPESNWRTMKLYAAWQRLI